MGYVTSTLLMPCLGLTQLNKVVWIGNKIMKVHYNKCHNTHLTSGAEKAWGNKNSPSSLSIAIPCHYIGNSIILLILHNNLQMNIVK